MWIWTTWMCILIYLKLFFSLVMRLFSFTVTYTYLDWIFSALFVIPIFIFIPLASLQKKNVLVIETSSAGWSAHTMNVFHSMNKNCCVRCERNVFHNNVNPFAFWNVPDLELIQDYLILCDLHAREMALPSTSTSFKVRSHLVYQKWPTFLFSIINGTKSLHCYLEHVSLQIRRLIKVISNIILIQII